MRRLGSFVSWRAMTQWTIWPGLMSFSPSFRLISLQCGGKIEETVTRFAFSIPASRSESSNDERRSLWMPAPCVKKIALGTNSSCIVGYPPGPNGTIGRFSFLGISVSSCETRISYGFAAVFFFGAAAGAAAAFLVAGDLAVGALAAALGFGAASALAAAGAPPFRFSADLYMSHK